jgi:Sec-independent protein translocase protein TatA
VDAQRWTSSRRNPLLSPADMLILGAAALLFFGPDQLPKVARRAGHVMRDIQSTSQSFIREMERAADEAEFKEAAARMEPVPYVAEPQPAETAAAEEKVPPEGAAG